MPNYDMLPYLQQAGFRGEALRKAWAVSQGESGGRADAFNGNAQTGDKSYGMFQINMLGDLGPDRRQRYGLKRNEDLFDPATNARVAFQMSDGGRNWKPWSAFTNNSYKKYYDQWKSQGGSGGPQNPLQPQAIGPPGDTSNQRKAAIAGLLDTVLRLSTKGAVQPNLFANTMRAMPGPVPNMQENAPQSGAGGFTGDFKSSLDALIAASGGQLSITSGYRSPERQAQLYAAAVKKYGSEAAARKWVAPPGKSRHGMGTAADISGNLSWAHKNAARFGLHFPMSWENWHIESQGSR